MWKGPTILMEQVYPFGGMSDPTNTQKHLVKKKLLRGDEQLEKTRILASLKHDSLIRLESLQEDGGDYWLLFEYVPQSVEKWYATVNREFIENYEQRLIHFSRYLAEKGIVVSFKRENMGLNDVGDAKYFLDTSFQLEPGVDKLALKKRYKDDIKHLLQYYIDKKNSTKAVVPAKPLPEKKENSKILRILETIEKGRANLCAETPKESNALVFQQSTMVEGKPHSKPIKSIQNVMIQKEVNKINKIQVIVNNRPVELLQQEFKREYASSSFYINGMPTVKLEREGEARRLLSPNDKLTRFEEVKYKEYKTMKTSGEFYVQDFINVLESDDTDKLTLPGSPRATLQGSSRVTLQSTPKNAIMGYSPKLAIEPEPKKEIKKV
jgi:hypothetical protein